MRITGIPKMAEQPDPATRQDRRRRLPVPVLIILGLYIGFVAYSLLSEDTLGAPATEAASVTDEESVTQSATNTAG